MKRSVILGLLLLGLTHGAWAIPTRITYQGTLKSNGVPVPGSYSVVILSTVNISNGGANRGSYPIVGTPQGAPAGEYLEDVANQPMERASPHAHTISTDGNHNHGGSTGTASSLPPYLGMVFCEKQ